MGFLEYLRGLGGRVSRWYLKGTGLWSLCPRIEFSCSAISTPGLVAAHLSLRAVPVWKVGEGAEAAWVVDAVAQGASEGDLFRCAVAQCGRGVGAVGQEGS